MSNVKISELPAGSNITADNLFPTSEGSSKTVKITWGQLKTAIIDTVYPVGSILTTTVWSSPSAVSAALGGTWVRASEGQVDVGYNSRDNNFNTINRTGGASSVALTVAQTPAHTHNRGTMEIEGSIRIALLGITDMEAYNGYKALQPLDTKDIKYGSNNAVTGSTASRSANLKIQASNGWTGSTSSVGGGEAHSNLQPYVVRYKYKRTV